MDTTFYDAEPFVQQCALGVESSTTACTRGAEQGAVWHGLFLDLFVVAGESDYDDVDECKSSTVNIEAAVEARERQHTRCQAITSKDVVSVTERQYKRRRVQAEDSPRRTGQVPAAKARGRR